MITERSDGTDAESYLHKDHLGSPISISDKLGNIVQQFTYDPWGKQTKIYQQASFLDLTFNQPTNRGYTGHEHIDGLDIIHMNGRIYDANLGRFMQADPTIQFAGNFQNYNRYSYIMNNPLTYTDPSGYSIFSGVRKFVKKYWRTIASIVIAVYLPYASFMTGWTTAASGALTGFVAGGVATGSLRGAVVGALTGAAFGGLHGIEGAEGLIGHAFTGGVGSVLNGGKFGHGFFSAGFTKALGGQFVKATNATQRMVNAIKAAVIGGTVSKLTGGKFASGAVTGAFSRLLNDDAAGKIEIKLTEDQRRDLFGKLNGISKKLLTKLSDAIYDKDWATVSEIINISEGSLKSTFGDNQAISSQMALRKLQTQFGANFVSATGTIVVNRILEEGAALATGRLSKALKTGDVIRDIVIPPPASNVTNVNVYTDKSGNWRWGFSIGGVNYER